MQRTGNRGIVMVLRQFDAKSLRLYASFRMTATSLWLQQCFNGIWDGLTRPLHPLNARWFSIRVKERSSTITVECFLKRGISKIFPGRGVLRIERWNFLRTLFSFG